MNANGPTSFGDGAFSDAHLQGQISSVIILVVAQDQDLFFATKKD